MLARAWVPGAKVEALQDLADGHLLVDQPAVEHAHQLGFGLVNLQVAGHAILLVHVAIAVGRFAGDDLAAPGLLQLAAPEAFAQQSPLVLGNRALNLEQELVIGIIRQRVLGKDHLAADPAQFFQEQHLVGVLTGQAVRAEHGHDLECAFAGTIAQPIQAGTVQPGAAVALVHEDVFVGQFVTLRLGPSFEQCQLAFYGLLPLLALGRDAGVNGNSH